MRTYTTDELLLEALGYIAEALRNIGDVLSRIEAKLEVAVDDGETVQ